MVIKIDIIILSYAKTEALKQVTLTGLESLFVSESPDLIQFEVLVIESNKSMFPYQYPHTTTIYPNEDFGFNKYMNIGIQKTSNDYICLCNNDLIYHKNWATEILTAMLENPMIKSANPYCGDFEYDQEIKVGADVIFRHKTMKINGVLTGWCLFVKRSVFDTTGFLDEQFGFWYADNDFDFTLRKNKLAHALIKKSKVTHLVSQSHDTLLDKKTEMTVGQKEKFEKKWLRKSFMEKLFVVFNDKLRPFKK